MTFLKIPIVKIKARIYDYNMQESSKNQQLQLSSPVPTEFP